MKVVTAKEMAEIDSLTIEKYGIPSLVLMERAALSVVNCIDEINDQTILVLAGPGNNGGDGIAVGRMLKNKGANVIVFQLFPEDKLSSDCKAQLQIAKNFGVPVKFGFPSIEEINNAQIIIDGIFGTGLKKPIEGKLAELIKNLNLYRKNTIAIDMPSGISSDTGEVLGVAIRAHLTVTFGLPKRGHFLFPGREYVGRLIIEDIGFPRELIESDKLRIGLLDKKLAKSFVPPRPLYSHKGTYGHVLVIAGSSGKTGAALMCAKSVLRTGAGLVTLAIPAALKVVFQSNVLEEMILSLPCNTQTLSSKAIEELERFINERADVVAFGPGVGINEDTEEILKFLLKKCACPIVIDADGITLLKNNLELLKSSKASTIITPHPGELGRLINMPIGDIERKRIEIAISVANSLNTIVVLKGVPTVISSPEGHTLINSTGNPGMASGGSGDVLTGMIASLIGQGMAPFEAACLGVYLHGLSGDIASYSKGFHGMIARDIIESIPAAFIELSK